MMARVYVIEIILNSELQKVVMVINVFSIAGPEKMLLQERKISMKGGSLGTKVDNF